MEQQILASVIPSIAEILAAHPFSTLKINNQIIGGGQKNLYAGVGFYLLKAVPSNSIGFYLLQQDYIQNMPGWLQGLTVRTIANTISHPLGLWSVKAQAGTAATGLYQGFFSTLGRDTAFSVVFLHVYRDVLGDQHPLLKSLGSATTASIATQSLDWYATKLQLNKNSGGMSSVMSGWQWRLLYCNVRSSVAWCLFEYMAQKMNSGE